MKDSLQTCLPLVEKALQPHRVPGRLWMPGPPCSNPTNGYRGEGTAKPFESIPKKCRPYSHFNNFPKIYGPGTCQFDQSPLPSNALFPAFSFFSLF